MYLKLLLSTSYWCVLPNRPPVVFVSMLKRYSSSSSSSGSRANKNKVVVEPPELPADCCEQGCINCVWLSYLDEVKEFNATASEEDKVNGMQHVHPSIKAFIEMEYKMKQK